MKTLRHILLALVILAQSAWLVFNFVHDEIEVKNAVHVKIPALRAPYSRSFTILEDVSLYAENPELGKSIWWDLPGNSSGRKPSVRPAPGDEVRGALGFTENYGREEPLAIFFSTTRNEWGRAKFRIEARGCSEDVAREGECRIEAFGRVESRSVLLDEDSSTGSYSLSLQFRKIDSLFDSADSFYELDDAMEDELSSWVERHKADGGWLRINASLELALRENKTPLPVALFLNGIPAEKAVELMRTDTFPMAPVAPAPKKEDEAAPASEAAPAPEAAPASEAAPSA